MAVLFVEEGPNRGAWFNLPDGEATIGRQAGSTVPLLDGGASRRHARIVSNGAEARVEDLGSRHGTCLNGLPLSGAAPLRAGDRLRMGATVMRYIAGDAAAAFAEAPSTVTCPGGPEARGAAFQATEAAPPPEIVAVSASMRRVVELVSRVAPRDTTVLITGETGTGKEVVARAIHRLGSRASRPFLAVNAAAFPGTLIAGELFGHERGAFTGAVARRKGLFEMADHGTLFLDEVGELSEEAQAMLLRVLETGDLRRVGGAEAVHVDVRLLAATHRDLGACVDAGRFREDLFHRLHVIEIAIPPLRDRSEDLGPLCEALLRAIAGDRRGPMPAIEPGAIARLGTYRFPGNVRELRNVLERALIVGDGRTIREADLSLEVSHAGPPGAGFPTLADAERHHVVLALARAGGVRGVAAAILGIDRKTLRKKVADYGLEAGQ